MTRKIYYPLCQVYICCYVLFHLSLGSFTKLIPSSNFPYSAIVKPRPLAYYIGMKISVLPPSQLVFTVTELTILQ